MTKETRRKLTGLLVIILLMMASFSYGIMSVRRQNAPFKAFMVVFNKAKQVLKPEEETGRGIWHKGRRLTDKQDLTQEEKAVVENLNALPYLRGYNSAPDVQNITVFDAERAYDGLNFVVSADKPHAFLMDMQGNILHEWHKDFTEVWPDSDDPRHTQVPPGAHRLYRTYWRRAYPLDNGEILAMFMGFGLFKLDQDSNILWLYDGRVHHDMTVAKDGTIFTLSRRVSEIGDLGLESWSNNGYVLEDFITILTPDGQEKKKISLLSAFQNSDYASFLEHMKSFGDIFHANTVELIEGSYDDRYPMLQKGSVLVSMREIHTIAVVDLELEKITWALTGLWKFQHEPEVLPNGHIMLFDNRGYNGRSRIVEIDPTTQEVVWSYHGTAEAPFYSREAGADQRLPNGNTLIVESEGGRALEVTPAGEIVWEFYNPYRAGENNELIAALYDVIRIDYNSQFCQGLLETQARAK